jgi:hypothetical protein
MAAWQQVLIDVEGRLDFRVGHELLDRFRLAPGSISSEAKVCLHS